MFRDLTLPTRLKRQVLINQWIIPKNSSMIIPVLSFMVPRTTTKRVETKLRVTESATGRILIGIPKDRVTNENVRKKLRAEGIIKIIKEEEMCRAPSKEV